MLQQSEPRDKNFFLYNKGEGMHIHIRTISIVKSLIFFWKPCICTNLLRICVTCSLCDIMVPFVKGIFIRINGKLSTEYSDPAGVENL